jgi:hypothetical protein
MASAVMAVKYPVTLYSSIGGNIELLEDDKILEALEEKPITIREDGYRYRVLLSNRETSYQYNICK